MTLFIVHWKFTSSLEDAVLKTSFLPKLFYEFRQSQLKFQQAFSFKLTSNFRIYLKIIGPRIAETILKKFLYILSTVIKIIWY
jgi:hypothetical protein